MSTVLNLITLPVDDVEGGKKEKTNKEKNKRDIPEPNPEAPRVIEPPPEIELPSKEDIIDPPRDIPPTNIPPGISAQAFRYYGSSFASA
jgi:hypothetical protein